MKENTLIVGIFFAFNLLGISFIFSDSFGLNDQSVLSDPLDPFNQINSLGNFANDISEITRAQSAESVVNEVEKAAEDRQDARDFAEAIAIRSALSNTQEKATNEAENEVTMVEQGNEGQKSAVLSKKDAEIQKQENRELDLQATTVVNTVNPPTKVCDNTKSDIAVHVFKGKVDLSNVIDELNNHERLGVEFIVDADPQETALVLLDSLSSFLKGRMVVDPYDSDPKTFDFDVDYINTFCITKTVIDETMEVESKTKDPLIVTAIGNNLLTLNTNTATVSNNAQLSGSGQIFQTCTNSDFMKYKLIGSKKYLDTSIPGGKVDVTVKVLVDLTKVQAPAVDSLTISDDNRALAMVMVVDEGKNNEEILEFPTVEVSTECDYVNFLQTPVALDDKRIVNPLFGFS